jgi:hypothetical protein
MPIPYSASGSNRWTIWNDLRHGPAALENLDLLKAAAFLRDLAFPPYVMQAGLIDAPQRLPRYGTDRLTRLVCPVMM